MTKEEAVAFRKLVELGSTFIDDKTISTAPDVLPRMLYSGNLIESGTRIKWGDTIKRATVDLQDIEENNPDKASTFWEDVMYKKGLRMIPEIITTESQFAKGEQGYWKDKIYESLIDGNIWNPEQYPDGWKIVE